jgi:hypothetical protein
VGPSGDLAPSSDTPEVAGTEEPQIERAVSPENGLLGVLSKLACGKRSGWEPAGEFSHAWRLIIKKSNQTGGLR